MNDTKIASKAKAQLSNAACHPRSGCQPFLKGKLRSACQWLPRMHDGCLPRRRKKNRSSCIAVVVFTRTRLKRRKRRGLEYHQIRNLMDWTKCQTRDTVKTSHPTISNSILKLQLTTRTIPNPSVYSVYSVVQLPNLPQRLQHPPRRE